MSDLLNSASLVMIPSGYKEDTVFSAIPTDGSGDLSFTRASNGTRVNSAGLVEVCPWNFNTNSENFITGWGNDGTTSITNNFTTAPNGTTTAAKVVVNTTNGYEYKNVPVLAPNTYTLSFYVKATANTTMSMAINDIGGSGGSGKYDIPVTTEWQRIEHSAVVTLGTLVYIDFGSLQTGKDYFIWGAQLNIGSTAKPYFPTTDRLNVPRLTYQNGGGGCPSLLLEKQSTNYLNYSNDFTQAAWSASGSITRTANYAVSPDGTQTATRIQWNGTDGELYQYLGQASPTRSSVYVKGTAGQVINFCLNLITLTGEWQRIEAASLIDGSNTWFGIITKSSVGHTATDFLLWGGQGENGTYATSLIYTTSASATRVADECRKTGISSLIGQSEGVIFADITPQIFNNSAYQTIAIIYPNAGLGGTYFHFYKNTGSTNLFFEVWNASSQCSMSYTMANNTRYKVAAGYKNNDFVLYVNGVQVGSDNTGTVASVTYSTLEMGYDSFNTDSQMSLSEFVLFPTRLTNAEIASLTTI